MVDSLVDSERTPERALHEFTQSGRQRSVPRTMRDEAGRIRTIQAIDSEEWRVKEDSNSSSKKSRRRTKRTRVLIWTRRDGEDVITSLSLTQPPYFPSLFSMQSLSHLFSTMMLPPKANLSLIWRCISRGSNSSDRLAGTVTSAAGTDKYRCERVYLLWLSLGFLARRTRENTKTMWWTVGTRGCRAVVLLPMLLWHVYAFFFLTLSFLCLY